MNHKEMTRYAFISHIEDYLKQLLKDPLHADTDEFLKYHGLNGPDTLSLLLKRSIPDDETSAILIKKIGIKDNGTDEEGNRLKDSFTVKYSIPRKDYTKKMRNLYINLFENNIIEDSPLNEGAWGYGILDNDSALDKQTSFGKYAISLLTHKLETSTNGEEKWANLGVLVDFLKKYDNEELHFSDDFNYAIELCKNYLNELNNDELFINSWNNQGKIRTELKKIYKDIMSITYDKNRLNETLSLLNMLNNHIKPRPNTQLSNEFIMKIKNIVNILMNNRQNLMNLVDRNGLIQIFKKVLRKYDDYVLDVFYSLLTDEDYEYIAMKAIKTALKNEIVNRTNPKTLLNFLCDVAKISNININTLNEEGEGGGATTADASGQYTTSLFGKPIKRKTMYITQEQEEYIKKILEEEAVMDTRIGNFGFDAPIGDGKKNKNNKFFAAANDHKDIMKKSWQNEE